MSDAREFINAFLKNYPDADNEQIIQAAHAVGIAVTARHIGQAKRHLGSNSVKAVRKPSAKPSAKPQVQVMPDLATQVYTLIEQRDNLQAELDTALAELESVREAIDAAVIG